MSAPAKGSPPTKANATRERGEGENKSSDSVILHHPDKSIKMELHPLCTLFPRLTGYELACLQLDIKENGLRESIVIYQTMILDGGNRYAACLAAGVEPTFIEFEGDNVAAFVLSANLHRRHLTPPQQAASVSYIQDWAKAQKHGGDRVSVPGNACSDTTKSRAALSGASVSTQKRADAVAKADPELAKQVAQGEVKLQKAVAQVAPQLSSRPKKQSAPGSTLLEPKYDPNEDALANAHDTVIALAEENQQLKDAIAVGHLPESEQTAGEIIKELRARVKTLEASESAIAAMRDSLLLENKGLKEQCEIQRRQIKKLEGK